MALRIWKQGYAIHNWAVYGRSVCSSCRNHFEAPRDGEETGSEIGGIFGECLKCMRCFYRFKQNSRNLYKVSIQQYTYSVRQNYSPTLVIKVC